MESLDVVFLENAFSDDKKVQKSLEFYEIVEPNDNLNAPPTTTRDDSGSIPTIIKESGSLIH